MLAQIKQNVSTKPEWKYLETSLPAYKAAIPQFLMSAKDWTGFKNSMEAADLSPSVKASLYNSVAWQIQETGENLALAEEFARNAVTISKSEWLNPSGKKPVSVTKKQWDTNRERTYGMIADTYAMVLYRLGEYKKGLTYAKESALTIGKGELASNNNTYALLAEKALPVKKYRADLEQFVKAGKAPTEVKQVLKRAYVKEHRSEAGYDDYITALEKENYLNMVATLRKSMLGTAAPSFALYDLNRKKVDIADLKDKVVVVDFWATWCGPCKASFPGMQKMVNKYKDNPEVKFVFIDTWEKGENKEKDATNFIAANKYTFHVLQDVDDKVVQQFKISGIPTKFVIDKNGIIRFKAIGFDGDDDKLMTELTAMIELAKDPDKKM